MVSFPTFSAIILKLPVVLIVAPITVSCSVFSTGIASPVIILSSIKELPSIILPSTGIRSPGIISKMSPFITSLIDISCSFLFRITLAVFTFKPISFLIESDVFDLAFASKYLPKRMSAIIITAASK